MHDINIILHTKKNMIDYKINYNYLKESRNKSRIFLNNYENNNIILKIIKIIYYKTI